MLRSHKLVTDSEYSPGLPSGFVMLRNWKLENSLHGGVLLYIVRSRVQCLISSKAFYNHHDA